MTKKSGKNIVEIPKYTGCLIGAVHLAEVTDQPDPNWEVGWWDGESLAWLLDDAMSFNDPSSVSDYH